MKTLITSTFIMLCLCACSSFVSEHKSGLVGKWYLTATWLSDSVFKEKERKYTYEKNSYLLLQDSAEILVKNDADIFLPLHTGEWDSLLTGKWWAKDDSLYFDFNQPRVVKERFRFRIINHDTLETAVKYDNEELYSIARFVKGQ